MKSPVWTIDTDGRVDGKSDAVDQAVRDPDRLDGERAQRKLRARSNLDQLGVIEHLVLFKLALDVGQGELRAVDGHVQLGENPRQAANVVLVSVREDDATDLLFVLDQIGDIGDDDVHAKKLDLGEHQAGVDDENVVFVADGEAVHAEFAQSAERNDL